MKAKQMFISSNSVYNFSHATTVQKHKTGHICIFSVDKKGR